MLRWAEQSGGITRLTHGVFVATAAIPSDAAGRHLQLALALQVRNPAAIASHHTAALAWDLDLDDPEGAAAAAPSFIVPAGPGRRSRSREQMSVAVRDLPTQHRTTHPSQLRLTTPERTAVDVAATVGLPEALITLDATLRLGLRSRVGERRLRAAYRRDRLLDEVRAPLLTAAQSAGTRLSRRHLEEVLPLADPRRESANESLSFGHMALAGLPLPELQVRLSTPTGDVYPDFLWAGHRVIGEADGAVKYRTPEDLVGEKRRQETLEQLGYRVVRWMYSDIRQRPASVMARIGTALDLGQAW